MDDTAYINTLFFGDPSKPLLVLTHGYNGSVLLFYKSLKSLAEHFRVIAFDIIGMGASSRAAFSCRTNTEADAFFMRAIEEWR